MILGITGGLGCGKSTAVQIFAECGFNPVDSDRLVREYVLLQPAVIEAVRVRFGDQALTAEGAVDRTRVASAIFEDDGARHWLEELTHPLVFAEWRALLATAPTARWIVEVPLLFEKQLENWFDFTICVTCAPALQLTRLEQRGLPRALAAQRISKQLPLARKIELSDIVLLNDGSPDFLHQQIDLVVGALPVAR
jgi:dephospho-CoA kinase